MKAKRVFAFNYMYELVILLSIGLFTRNLGGDFCDEGAQNSVAHTILINEIFPKIAW